MNVKTIIASGNFNPIHVGHIDYLNTSRFLGHRLIVIVNNDAQVKLKKNGKVFMNDKDRKTIVDNLRCTDLTIISIDTEKTQCKTLRWLRKEFPKDEMIFTNGGDVTEENHNEKEKQTCEELDIKCMYLIGGAKTESSSRLIENAN